MCILKTFRKPKFSIFLSLIVLFLSCSKPNSFDNTEQISIEDYTKKHISLTNELLNILNMQKEVNIKNLETFPNSFKSIEEFGLYLENANFEKSSRITVLFDKIQNNTNNFISNFGSLNQEEITNKITSEINRQIDTNSKIYSFRTNDCRDTWNTANDRCNRNFYIAAAAVGISTFFTLGIGTAIGGAAAITTLTLCKTDADNDYNDCMDYNY